MTVTFDPVIRRTSLLTPVVLTYDAMTVKECPSSAIQQKRVLQVIKAIVIYILTANIYKRL